MRKRMNNISEYCTSPRGSAAGHSLPALVLVVERRGVAQRHGARRRVGVRRGAQRVRARRAPGRVRVRRARRAGRAGVAPVTPVTALTPVAPVAPVSALAAVSPVATLPAVPTLSPVPAIAALPRSRQGTRVSRRAGGLAVVAADPVLGGLLPVGGLGVAGGSVLRVRRVRHVREVRRGGGGAARGGRQEIGLAGGRGEGRHVGSLRGGRVGRVDVGWTRRMGGRVEGRRVVGRCVVSGRGQGRARGRRAGRGGGRRLTEVLLEPAQQSGQRVERALPVLVPVRRHGHVLVRAARSRQVGQQEAPGVVLGG